MAVVSDAERTTSTAPTSTASGKEGAAASATASASSNAAAAGAAAGAEVGAGRPPMRKTTPLPAPPSLVPRTAPSRENEPGLPMRGAYSMSDPRVPVRAVSSDPRVADGAMEEALETALGRVEEAFEALVQPMTVIISTLDEAARSCATQARASPLSRARREVAKAAVATSAAARRAQAGMSQDPLVDEFDESRSDGDVVGGLGLPDCSEAFERASHAHLRSCQRAEASDKERDERLCSVHRALMPSGPLISLEGL